MWVEMPIPIKVRTSLRWYTLRSLLVIMELLSRNSLVLYYDAQLRDYAEPLRARIHGSFTGWYRFWREQYAAGDRVQSPAESVLGYAELLCAITTTYTLGENVFGPGNAKSPTAAAGDGDDYERYGYPALLSPCRAYLDTTLGTYLNDFEAWLTALQRIPPVPLAGASAGPALDFEHCAHLLAVLDATARLSERAFGKSKVGPLARRFARLFLTQLLRMVQARSGDWVVSALQADKPTEPDATDGVVYSTSVDDVLCCVVEPFDLVRSVPNLDPTLRTWTLEHLMGLVYRTLAVYCAAMTEKFMEGLAVTAPGAASTAPAYPSSTRLEAWANRARVWTRLPGEASHSLSAGTTTGPNHPLLVLDPTACLPLNNLFQVSRRIHELFAPYLTGPAPPHPLANVANGDDAANFRLSRARNSLRRPAGLPARVPSTPCGADDHSSDAVHALTVTVVHGEGLEPRSRARPRSPYVKLALPHLGLKVGKTGNRAATLVPRWDEAFPLWFGGREVQTNLGTATLSTTPVPLTMTVALYDRDGLQGGTLFALGHCTLDLTRLAMDRNIEDVWVDLKPRGRVLLRLAYADHGLGGTDATRPRANSAGRITDAVDFDRDPLDIQHTYTCVTWLLRRSLDDLARRIVESIIPVVQRELTAERLLPPNRRLAALKRSGQQLRRLLAGGDTLPSDRRTGSPRPSTATIAAADPSAHPASESEGPLDDLFHFLNSNLAVLFQHAHFAISRPVILSIWREIVLAIELVLLPSLPRLRAVTGQDTRPVLTPDPSLTSPLSPATRPSSSPPLPRPARPSFLGNRAPLAHLAHASRKLIPAGLRTKTPQLPIEDVDFVWECLDAIEWFFLGGDTATHRRVLTAADLHEIPEYRAVAYIRDHYFDSTPRLIRDYMHTTGERLRIAQRWEGFGGATASAAMANEDLMAAVELVDPIGPTTARASPDIPPRRDSAQPDSPGRVPVDQPAGADNFPGAVSMDWLRTKIDIVLRILQTRYGLDDEAVDFVDSHHADAVI
ncbi:hypothetical protein IWQ60_006466 [Tieghemiomyces parasiticus]|uniref:C2 domain-containing protein n=1 Tax=Tieghemiomyces parasiticus TaxID=78921 RepID=A0A9W8DXY5_9FUNG|nr:hypothetical protein IWQ60_006466 [Tieghemiomyces parasiticus]